MRGVQEREAEEARAQAVLVAKMHNLWVESGQLSVVFGARHEQHRDPRAHFEHAQQLVNDVEGQLAEAEQMKLEREAKLDDAWAETNPAAPDFDEPAAAHAEFDEPAAAHAEDEPPRPRPVLAGGRR